LLPKISCLAKIGAWSRFSALTAKRMKSAPGGNQASSEQSKRCGKKDEATQTGIEIWWRCWRMACGATIASAIRLRKEASSLIRNTFFQGFPVTFSIVQYMFYTAVSKTKSRINFF
jgi:hypothetical protein